MLKITDIIFHFTILAWNNQSLRRKKNLPDPSKWSEKRRKSVEVKGHTIGFNLKIIFVE